MNGSSDRVYICSPTPCSTLFFPSFRYLSSILGNKFDHGAESVMPILLNLVPNSAKIMATSGMATIRLILRVRHLERRVDVVAQDVWKYFYQSKFTF